MAVQLSRERHAELIAKAGVLSVGIAEKLKAGQGTGTDAIVVYVAKKIPADQLGVDLIPAELDGMPTDVIELAPEGWSAGQTEISKMHPDDVRKRFGLSETPAPKATTPAQPKAFNQHANWTGYASARRDQANCGSCTGEGAIDTTECEVRVSKQDPSYQIALSVAAAFFCSGGTCSGGNTPEAVFDYIVKTGVPTEACYPYKDVDQPCGQGRCTDWQNQLFKLAGYDTVTDVSDMKARLDSGPLNGTMAVHQSFLSYTGGKYKHLATGDPIIGYHSIEVDGHDEPTTSWYCGNSWGTTQWGQNCVIDGVPRPGFFIIDQAELDPQMYDPILQSAPVVTVSKKFKVGLSDVAVSPTQPIAGAAGVVTVTKPDGSSLQLSGQTDTTGQMILTQDLPVGNGYSAKYDYAGQPGKYLPCSAGPVSFDVTPPSPTPPPAPSDHETGATLAVE